MVSATTATSPSGVPRISVSGSSREVGLAHGSLAKDRIIKSVEFYKTYFEESAELPWAQATSIAGRFVPFLADSHADLLEELQGVADGAGLELEEVLALNARSEIALSTDWSAKAPPLDGCTAFAWKQDGRQWSGQNWDWKEIATDFLIVIEIDAHEETGRPAIKMMTEAGVIGKIGLNEHGVCTMLNALRIPSNRFDSLPVHLFLRRMLERPSLPSALTYLHEQCHNASASTANVVLAGPDSAVSIELHPDQSEVIEPDEEGFVRHTNHLVQLKDEREMFLWPDSMRRLPRLETLTRQALEQGEKVRYETYRRILSDRSDGERSICRFEAKGIVTVFSIAVDCAGRRAEVKLGRPDEEGEVLVLEFAYRGD